jgi:hypothetical protein
MKNWRKRTDHFKITLADDEISKCKDPTRYKGVHFDIVKKVTYELIDKYNDKIRLLCEEHYKDRRVTFIEESLNVEHCTITFTIYFEDLKQ